MEKARLSDSILKSVLFKNAKMNDVEMDGINAVDTCFEGASIQESIFVKASLKNCLFRKANLTSAGFRRSYLKNTTLEHAVLTNADFSRALLTSVNLRWSDVTGADFSSVRLGPAQVYKMQGYSGNINEMGCDELDFSKAGDGSDFGPPERLQIQKKEV